jgi:hypothetical protein
MIVPFAALAMYSHAAIRPVVIRTVHNSATEVATEAQLKRLLANYDVEPWTFTHEVLIDQNAIPNSHPVLKLHTRPSQAG